MLILTKASQQRQNIVEIQKNWIFSLALLLLLSLSLSFSLSPSLSLSLSVSLSTKKRGNTLFPLILYLPSMESQWKQENILGREKDKISLP